MSLSPIASIDNRSPGALLPPGRLVIVAVAIASLGLLTAPGCSIFSSGSFACQQDVQCDRGTDGICQPNGFCSFPDSSCMSGQRYEELSGSVSGLCVGDETVEPPVVAWWDTSFAQRHRIELGATPTADLADFPVLVKLDGTRVDYSAIRDAGEDLRFVAADDTTELAYEIEEYNEAGASYVWVKLPQITTTAADNHFYLYYGNAEATDGQQATQVWSPSYAAVYHLNEAVTDEAQGGVHADATGLGNNGTQRNNSRADDSQGCIAGCQSFDADDDRIEIGQAGLQVTGKTITIEARVRLRTAPNDFPHVCGGGSDGRYWQLYWRTGGNGWGNRLRTDNNTEIGVNRTASGQLDTWATLAAVYDGANVRLLLDGVEIGSTPATDDLFALDTALSLGANPGIGDRDFDGLIDEVRISPVARTDEWLSFQHASLTDSLLTYGAAETQP